MGNRQAWYTGFARAASRLAGHPVAFVLGCVTLVAWAASGPFFDFSDTWQLVINTGTTIITFLMVFLIQSSQNRDTIAIHVKLDELVRAIKEAKNSVLDLDGLDEADLQALLADYQKLAVEARAGKTSSARRDEPEKG